MASTCQLFASLGADNNQMYVQKCAGMASSYMTYDRKNDAWDVCLDVCQ